MAEQELKLSVNQVVGMAENERRKIAELESNMNAVRNMLRDTDNTVTSLDEIKENEGKELFIALGAGVYAKAEVKDSKKFLATLPAGVVLNKSMTETNKMLEDRKTSLKKDAEEISKALQSAVQNLRNLEGVLQKIAANQKKQTQ